MPFVSVEGIDGAGKSTVIEGLAMEYPDAVLTSFPSADRPAGNVIRSLLSDDRTEPATERSNIEELLVAWLFLADHIDQWEHEISPVLEDDDLIISDRYIDSLYATQGVTLSECFDDAVAVWQEFATLADTGQPDVTLVIDVPIDVALNRVDENPDQYETADILKRKRDVYRRLAGDSKRVVVLDGTQPPESVITVAIRAVETIARPS